MATADIVMLGHFDAAEVAYYGIGITPFVVLLLIGIGLLTGTLIMTSHARGAGRPGECGAVWRRSLPYALAIGAVGAFFGFFGEAFLLAIGQTPAIAAGGGSVMAFAAFALPLTLVHSSSAFFLEGLARPMPGMIVILAANILNILLNWVLIFGVPGLPAMGADGAILATSITRCSMAIVLTGYIWWLPDRETWGIRRPLGRGWWRDGREQWRLGYATGISQGLESIAFNSLTMMAGLLGPLALASYSISLNLLALVFMLALGLGAATAVRVGAARGAGDRRGMVAAAWVGLATTAVVMSLIGTVIWLLRGEVAAIYTSEIDLLVVLPELFAIIALLLIPDGGQVVMSFALRGAGEAWVPTALHLVAFIIVMIPAAWLLAFPLGLGTTGLMTAIAMGAGTSLTILSLRFLVVSRRR